MEAFISLLFLLFIVGLFLGYKGVKKYFKWIEETTGNKPLNKISITIIVLMFLLPSMRISAVSAPTPSTIDVVLFLILFGVLCYYNRRMGELKHIILVSILSVIFSIVIAFIAMFILILSFMGNSSGISGTKKFVNSSSKSYSDRKQVIGRDGNIYYVYENMITDTFGSQVLDPVYDQTGVRITPGL